MVSLRQIGHGHSELFFEHCDPVNIAVWSDETVGDSESFGVRRERIFASDVELFGYNLSELRLEAYP